MPSPGPSPKTETIGAPLIPEYAWSVPAWVSNVSSSQAPTRRSSRPSLLMSPHAMFYDAGLLVITAVVALDRLGSRVTAVLAAVWAGSWLQMGAAGLGFAPLFVLMVGGLAIVATRWKSGAPEAVAAA